MAERRMFTKKVTDDDTFMSLSSSAQALYLHLSMSADDDGFCNQVTICMFKAHASVQDLEALLEKRYIYQFENGVIVIRHWRMANALRKDRYTPTVFKKELSQLGLDETGEYERNPLKNDAYIDGCQTVASRLPDGCQSVARCLPQDRIDKDRIDKDRIDKDILYGVDTQSEFISIPLSDGTEYPVLETLVEEYENLYPRVNVQQELRSMKAWCLSNPEKRKTKKGIKRFINGWLNKAQQNCQQSNKDKFKEIDTWHV